MMAMAMMATEREKKTKEQGGKGQLKPSKSSSTAAPKSPALLIGVLLDAACENRKKYAPGGVGGLGGASGNKLSPFSISIDDRRAFQPPLHGV